MSGRQRGLSYAICVSSIILMGSEVVIGVNLDLGTDRRHSFLEKDVLFDGVMIVPFGVIAPGVEIPRMSCWTSHVMRSWSKTVASDVLSSMVISGTNTPGMLDV